MSGEPELLARSVTEDHADFDFVCHGCGSQGDISVPLNLAFKPIGCPEGCGATFVLWQFGLRWRLRCVVQPFRRRA